MPIRPTSVTTITGLFFYSIVLTFEKYFYFNIFLSFTIPEERIELSLLSEQKVIKSSGKDNLLSMDL